MKKVCGIGEILIRYSNIKNQQFNNGELVQLNYGGAEYNTICNLSNWGHEAYLLTKISANWLGQQAISNLKKFGGQTDFIVIDESLTSRIGTYSLLNLTGSGISQVIYDRQNSAFCYLKTTDFDCEALFNKVDTLYVSGISLAVDTQVQKTILTLVKAAKKNQKTVVFDFNYRAKLWTYAQAKPVYEAILPFCDFVSCSLNDLKKVLQFQLPNLGGDEDQELVAYYQMLMAKYPNLKQVFQTKRQIISPVTQIYQGFIFNGEQLFKSPCYQLTNYVDRVGSGDAFISGVIHSLINQENEQATIDFATKAGALKHFYPGDNTNLALDQIKLFNQRKDISR